MVYTKVDKGNSIVILRCIYTSRALFANVWKCFQTSKSICKHAGGAPVHIAWACLQAVILEHSTKFPTWYPGYQNLCLSKVILSENQRKKCRIFIFERKKLCATVSKFEGRWNGTFKKFQPHVIIGFLYFTKGNWTKSIESRYYFLMIVSFICAYFLNCIILHLHTHFIHILV